MTTLEEIRRDTGGRGRSPRGRGRAAAARLFAGDPRVWRVAAIAGGALAVLILVWCLVPRPYYTGSDSAEDDLYALQVSAGGVVCEPDLRIPAQTAGLRLRVQAAGRERPALHLLLRLGDRSIASSLAPTRTPKPTSTADFPIPQRPASPAVTPASLCVTAAGPVGWGGTPAFEQEDPRPTVDGTAAPERLAIWYLPRTGATRSYVEELGAIFARAALFRASFVGAWTFPLLLFVVLPVLALLAVRCLAVAVAGQGRRLALWVFAIAAVNACCWALITPSFFAPDEVDHFAYTQSLVERGEGPARSASSPLPRWSTAEQIALEGEQFLTDHSRGDGKLPWLAADERQWRARAATHPARDDGGGYTTSAVHGPLYYLAVAPGYLLARDGSPFTQLTLMRLISALLGAIAALGAFLLARELAPRRPWLGVLAGLLVAFEPMYGFISGAVNNDVGVNAGAALLAWLLMRMLRRGVTPVTGAACGVLLVGLPIVKGTAYELWPAAILILLATAWRHHRRASLPGWLALGASALVLDELSIHLAGTFHPVAADTSSAVTSVGATSLARAHPAEFVSYLWQVFLPRLPFMHAHFRPGAYPAFVIFVERGFAAFGWYDVYFPGWVYSVILIAMIATPVLALWAARREWTWVRVHWLECAAVILIPVCVVVGFEAAYFDLTIRPAIAEFGRYAFPAIAPLAVLVVGALHAFGRPRIVYAGTALIVAMLALSYASQLLVLTHFYA